MSLTGMVDKRTLEKYEREAREKSRESWYLSWALDTNQEGKTRRVPRISSLCSRKPRLLPQNVIRAKQLRWAELILRLKRNISPSSTHQDTRVLCLT